MVWLIRELSYKWNTTKTIYHSLKGNRTSLISFGAELHSWLIKVLSIQYTYTALRCLTCYWMILKDSRSIHTQKWQTACGFGIACYVSRLYLWMDNLPSWRGRCLHSPLISDPFSMTWKKRENQNYWFLWTMLRTRKIRQASDTTQFERLASMIHVSILNGKAQLETLRECTPLL